MTLFDAIEHGDLRTLRKLMRTGVALEQVDEASGMAPLALAAYCGRLDMVRILLRAGVDPDWGGATTPLEAAAVEGHVDVAAELIDAHADVNRPVADGFTPLITAASTGNLEMVRTLLDAGANPMVIDDEGQTALAVAKKKGHQEIAAVLKAFLSNGNGYRPGSARDLMEAIEDRDLERVKDLLARDDGGEQTNAPGRDGLTPIARAAQLGHVALVRGLLEAGADVEAGGAQTPLLCAVRNRHDPVMAALVDEGADVNAASGEEARTPLMAAAAAGSVELVRGLIEAGADAKLLDADGKDALWHAAASGQEQTFALLLPHVKVADRKAATAELAARVETRRKLATSAARLIDHIHAGEHAEAKRWLASGLIDPDGFDEDGRTAMMLAARLGRRDILRMLIAAGASFELRDDVEGHTALIHAIHSPTPDAHLTVSILAASGADLNRPSNDGRTPLMHAVDRYLEMDREDVAAFTALAEPLLHLGAEIEARDGSDLTAWQRLLERACREDLALAERRKLARVRRVLEKNGARITGAWRLDLMTAVAEGQAGRVRDLLHKLDDPGRLEGLPVLAVAAANDHWDVASDLLGFGLDIDSPNDKGDTILIQAAAKGTLPIVEQLAQAGADPAAENNAGETAASLARAAGHDDVAEFLKKWSKK